MHDSRVPRLTHVSQAAFLVVWPRYQNIVGSQVVTCRRAQFVYYCQQHIGRLCLKAAPANFRHVELRVSRWRRHRSCGETFTSIFTLAERRTTRRAVCWHPLCRDLFKTISFQNLKWIIPQSHVCNFTSVPLYQNYNCFPHFQKYGSQATWQTGLTWVWMRSSRQTRAQGEGEKEAEGLPGAEAEGQQGEGESLRFKLDQH